MNPTCPKCGAATHHISNMWVCEVHGFINNQTIPKSDTMYGWEIKTIQTFGSKYMKETGTNMVFEIIGPECNQEQVYCMREMKCGQFGLERIDKIKEYFTPVLPIFTEENNFVLLENQEIYVRDKNSKGSGKRLNSDYEYGNSKKTNIITWIDVNRGL